MVTPEPVLDAAQQKAYAKVCDRLEAEGFGRGDGCWYELVAYPDGVVLEQRLPTGEYRSYDLS